MVDWPGRIWWTGLGDGYGRLAWVKDMVDWPGRRIWWTGLGDRYGGLAWEMDMVDWPGRWIWSNQSLR